MEEMCEMNNDKQRMLLKQIEDSRRTIRVLTSGSVSKVFLQEALDKRTEECAKIAYDLAIKWSAYAKKCEVPVCANEARHEAVGAYIAAGAIRELIGKK